MAERAGAKWPAAVNFIGGGGGHDPPDPLATGLALCNCLLDRLPVHVYHCIGNYFECKYWNDEEKKKDYFLISQSFIDQKRLIF